MRYLIIPLIILFFLYPTNGNAEEMVTVKLVNYLKDTSEVSLSVTGEYFSPDLTLFLEEGVNYQLIVKKETFYLRHRGTDQLLGKSFMLIPRQYDEDHVIKINDRPYLGAMEFVIEKDKFIRPINQLPLEDYLKGVVPHEVFPSWDLEALKAQTLAARTYAARHLNNKEMDDTISFQVYGGYEWHERTTKAVNETKGEVITYNNRLIEAFYSASNGGVTESNKHVWGGKALAYFPIKKDPFDPIHPWEFSLHQTQINIDDINWENANFWDGLQEKDQELCASIKNKLAQKGYIGDIKILSIPHFELDDKQYPSERSIKGSITIDFLHRLFDGTILIEQLSLENVALSNIRPMIGGNRFKSYLIDSLQKENGVYTMSGRGYGHGVGMSQWGANYMGEYGKSYKEVIEYYYPHTEIKTISNL